MLISGFTFIRNAQKYDFPILECVESMLPLVDELIINIGKSDDGTEEWLKAELGKNPKVRFLTSVWDDSKTKDGLILSEQTNIALDACKGKWCLYLQGDEALHESEHEQIRKLVDEEDGKQKPADGFRFRYLHFYGGYSVVQRELKWYPSEIRIIRRESGARSYGDAQSFQKADGQSLNTRLIDAHIFHYGHARKPEVMADKIKYFHRFWHGDSHGIKVTNAYRLQARNLTWYWGEHPSSYRKRVEEGKTWSPTTRAVAGISEPKIVVLYCKAEEKGFAEQVKAAIEDAANPAPEIVIVSSAWQWLRTLFSRIFPRKAAVVVDLSAEKRNSILFALWVPDALLSFQFSLAHSPSGKLSNTRAKLYSAVNWGAHERTEEGFHVPESEHPRQIVRWLGLGSGSAGPTA